MGCNLNAPSGDRSLIAPTAQNNAGVEIGSLIAAFGTPEALDHLYGCYVF